MGTTVLLAEKPKTSTRWSERCLDLVLAWTPVPFFIVAFFAQPGNDDFYFADLVRAHGFFGAQHVWYSQWTGRVTSSVIISAFCHPSLIVRAYYVGPIVFLIISFVAIGYLTRAAAALGTSASPFRANSLRVAALTYVLFLNGMPGTSEGVYWTTGAFTHPFSILLLLILLALLVSRQVSSSAWVGGASFLLAALACSASEIGLVATTAVVAPGIALWGRRRINSAWISAGVGCLIGGIIILLAPGNRVRSAAEGVDSHHLASVIPHAIVALVGYTRSWITASVLLATPIIGAYLRPAVDQIRDRLGARSVYLIALPILLASLIAGLVAVVQWATGGAPPLRAWDAIFLIFLLGWFPSVLIVTSVVGGEQALDSLTSVSLRGQVAPILMLVLLLQGNGLTVLTALARTAPKYRAEWQSRYEQLRAAAGRNAPVVLPPLQHVTGTLMTTDLTDNPDYWTNLGYAEFFGDRSIVVPGAVVSQAVIEHYKGTIFSAEASRQRRMSQQR